mgnify:CR=1 FL=1
MSKEEKLEDKIHKTEQKLLELSLVLNRLDGEYQKLLEEMSFTPKQIKEYAENPNNFAPPIWEFLQNEKKMLDEKLNLELSNINDLTKTTKTLSERGQIQKHWLFVR